MKYIYKCVKPHIITLYQHVLVTLVTIVTGCFIASYPAYDLLFVRKEDVSNYKKLDYECMNE